MAYEVDNMDGLMRGAGRMKNHGFKVEWGVGRHGPGDNVFAYFVEPNGFVVEYTTEVQQVDEATYKAHGRRLLARISRCVRAAGAWPATRPTASGRGVRRRRSPIRKPASAARRSWRRRCGGKPYPPSS